MRKPNGCSFFNYLLVKENRMKFQFLNKWREESCVIALISFIASMFVPYGWKQALLFIGFAIVLQLVFADTNPQDEDR
jgi:hypothetical protein